MIASEHSSQEYSVGKGPKSNPSSSFRIENQKIGLRYLKSKQTVRRTTYTHTHIHTDESKMSGEEETTHVKFQLDPEEETQRSMRGFEHRKDLVVSSHVELMLPVLSLIIVRSGFSTVFNMSFLFLSISGGSNTKGKMMK
jgi:hypothetical protein